MDRAWGTSKVCCTALIALGVAACDEPSLVGLRVVSSTSAATSTSSGTGGAGGEGGAAPCASLVVTEAVTVESEGAEVSRPRLVLGSESGRHVSVFFASGAKDAPTRPLRVVTIEPWEAWPPKIGFDFDVGASGGEAFAVAQAQYGKVGLLTHRSGEEDDSGEGLYFMPDFVSTAPSGVFLARVDDDEKKAVSAHLVSGYDAPPIAPNLGFMQALLVTETVSPSGMHDLRFAVSPWSVWFLTATVQPPLTDPSLACASQSIVADGVRVGQSWLVAAASGSDLVPCDVAPDAPPTNLVIDRIAWGAPDEIVWTLTQPTTLAGDAPIDGIRMASSGDAAWILVHREGERAPVLVRANAIGEASNETTFAIPKVGDVVDATVSTFEPSSGGVVLSQITGDAITASLVGADGGEASRVTIAGEPNATEISAVTSRAGDAVVLAWVAGGALRVARATCAEAP